MCAAEGYTVAMQRCPASKPHLAQALGELLKGVQEELKLHDAYAGVRLWWDVEGVAVCYSAKLLE